MKKITLTIVCCLVYTAFALAQKRVPDTGCWVVESNIKTPKNYIINFYNDKHELIYQEKINGKKINIDKTKTKNTLNSVLAIVLKNDGFLKDSLLYTALFSKNKGLTI